MISDNNTNIYNSYIINSSFNHAIYQLIIIKPIVHYIWYVNFNDGFILINYYISFILIEVSVASVSAILLFAY